MTDSIPLKVLQLHEKTVIHGGAEVYISQLQSLLGDFGSISYWIGINEVNEVFEISVAGSDSKITYQKIEDVFKFLKEFITANNIDLINIHNQFNPSIVNFCFSNLPVVKSVHSPVMVCPGRDKFWRFSEKPCTIKFGLHCFYHIYTEGCSNRHPKRIKKAWEYVQYEVNDAASRYKKIIVMSDYMRHGLLECSVPDTKILVNPYFTPLVDEESNINVREVKRLLFIGRLVSSKGPHIMISALSEILNSNHNVFLDIIGDGLMMDELTQLVNSLGLQSKVVFHGWKKHEEIDIMIRDSYLVLFPSVYPEAFGIVGIEAMMRNKPVIAFGVGGVATWLKDGINGFLVPAKDQEIFKNKVQHLLEDSVLYSSMCDNAREIAINQFTPDVHIKKLLEVYSAAILDN